MNQEVITVDFNDKAIGTMEKMEAHRTGTLHRAFSVFIFNTKNEMLIHKRADGKYHSAGLWTNTCCSHPRVGEDIYLSAENRLVEEMGIKCKLKKLFSFIYKAHVENGLIEYEFDHVFVGFSDAIPIPDINEVQDWKWISPDVILGDFVLKPEKYTAWFRMALPKVVQLEFSNNIVK